MTELARPQTGSRRPRIWITRSLWLPGLAFLAFTGCKDDPTRDEVSEPGLTIIGQDVRGCDLAFRVDEPVIAIEFGRAVRGRYFQRGARLGVSLISRRDQALDASQVTFQIGSDALPELISAVCVDRLGQPLRDVQVEVVP